MAPTTWHVGGCKAGVKPTEVVGSALVIEDNTQAASQALKAVADCMMEGTSTYQVWLLSENTAPASTVRTSVVSCCCHIMPIKC